MKELKASQHILGMRIEQERSKKTLRLSNLEYIKKVLKNYRIDNLETTPIPLPISTQLSNEGVSFDIN